MGGYSASREQINYCAELLLNNQSLDGLPLNLWVLIVFAVIERALTDQYSLIKPR